MRKKTYIQAGLVAVVGLAATCVLAHQFLKDRTQHLFAPSGRRHDAVSPAKVPLDIVSREAMTFRSQALLDNGWAFFRPFDRWCYQVPWTSSKSGRLTLLDAVTTTVDGHFVFLYLPPTPGAYSAPFPKVFGDGKRIPCEVSGSQVEPMPAAVRKYVAALYSIETDGSAVLITIAVPEGLETFREVDVSFASGTAADRGEFMDVVRLRASWKRFRDPTPGLDATMPVRSFSDANNDPLSLQPVTVNPQSLDDIRNLLKFIHVYDILVSDSLPTDIRADALRRLKGADPDQRWLSSFGFEGMRRKLAQRNGDAGELIGR